MKLYFSKEPITDLTYTHIRDINLIDILADDLEAEEILIENFLNQFTYNMFGQVLNKIVSKLRLGGEIIVCEYDIEFLCHKLSIGKIDTKEFNEIVFSGGPANCLFKMDTVIDLLQQGGLRIVEKVIDANDLYVVKARREL